MSLAKSMNHLTDCYEYGERHQMSTTEGISNCEEAEDAAPRGRRARHHQTHPQRTLRGLARSLDVALHELISAILTHAATVVHMYDSCVDQNRR